MSPIQYSRDYDKAYSPAMPVVDFALLDPSSGEKSSQLTAIIDSGADISLLPVNALQQLGLTQIRKVRMRGVSGVSQIMDQYLVGIEIGGIVIWGVTALADKGNREAIIGRDVLNQLVLTLNGLAEVVEISS